MKADDVEWMPLGVFAITEENATDSGMMVQLAVSKDGIIAGTFYNDLTDSSRPVDGMVDQETQRAAWRFADDKNPEIVMETGIYNLTQDEATALVHFGSEETQTWRMIRLPAPKRGIRRRTIYVRKKLWSSSVVWLACATIIRLAEELLPTWNDCRRSVPSSAASAVSLKESICERPHHLAW